MTGHFDIAVVGSGASGIAAAVTAARAGCRTLLLDSAALVGGTGGLSGLTTLCGLYDHQGQFLNGGFTREFAEALSETKPVQMGRVWVLPYRPASFCEIATQLLSGVATCWNSPVTGIVAESRRVVQINGVNIGAVIDCSGTAEVARAVGADCLETDETTQAPAVVFSLRNVTADLGSTAAMARILLPLARAGLPFLSLLPNLEPDSVTIKFSGACDQVADVVNYLRQHVSGFENCRWQAGAQRLARRAGRMIVGQYVLRGSDVLEGKHFPDGVVRGAWPIEQWNVSGVSRFRYMEDGTFYEIPDRCLQSANFENLYMAGKTLSADLDAIGSARVMGCCLATGAAAAALAARHSGSGTPERAA